MKKLWAVQTTLYQEADTEKEAKRLIEIDTPYVFDDMDKFYEVCRRCDFPVDYQNFNGENPGCMCEFKEGIRIQIEDDTVEARVIGGDPKGNNPSIEQVKEWYQKGLIRFLPDEK